MGILLAAMLQAGAPPEDSFEAVYGPNWDWAVHAGSGGFSLIESDGAYRSFRFFAPPRLVRRDNVTRLETRTASGAPVVLSISSEVCRSSGGSVYPYTARLEVDGSVKNGCAWGRTRYSDRERSMLGDYDLNSRIAARGDGPAWEAQFGVGGPNHVKIGADTFVETDERAPTIRGNVATYRLRGESGRTAEATLRRRDCMMAGRRVPFTVEVRAGNRRLRGCAHQTTYAVGPPMVTMQVVQPRLVSGRIDQADYPTRALRDEAAGRVRYEYLLDTTGRVTACAVRYSSGHVALDQATCRLVTHRFRYEPMRDSAGNAIPYEGMASHVWTLPSD